MTEPAFEARTDFGADYRDSFESTRTWRASDALEVDERTFDPRSRRLAAHYTYAYDDGRRAEHDLGVRLPRAARAARVRP